MDAKNRREQFLQSIAGKGTAPDPITREEELLKDIAKKVNSGGGGGSGLPEVTVADNGKLLTVVGGEWDKANAPTGLPAVTGSDNGKVLAVVEGAWDKADAEKEIVNINYTGTITDIDTMTISWTCDKTYAQISAARTSGKQIQAVATIPGGVGALVIAAYALLTNGIAFTAVGSLDNSYAQYISLYHSNADNITSKIVNITSLS